MEAALVAKLLATTGITTLVGQRITWVRRGQAAQLPAIVLHVIDGPRDYHLGGPSGLVASRVQVDCWAQTFLDAKRVARAVTTAVSGARFTQGGVRFDGILVLDEADGTEDLNGKPFSEPASIWRSITPQHHRRAHNASF